MISKIAKLSFLVTTTLLSISCRVHAQSATLPAGSASNALQKYNYEQLLLDQQRAFESAKKITLLSPPPDVNKCKSSKVIKANSINSGTIGRFVNEAGVGPGNCLIFDIVSIADKQNMILYSPSLKTTIWLEGYPTDGFADGQKTVIIDYVTATETKTYTTILGASSTVWAFKLMSKEETQRRMNEDAAAHARWEEELSKFAASKNGSKPQPESAMKIWKLKNGKSVEGRFLELKSGNLQILDRNGKQSSIKSSSLIDADRNHAIQQQKESNKTKGDKASK